MPCHSPSASFLNCVPLSSSLSPLLLSSPLLSPPPLSQGLPKLQTLDLSWNSLKNLAETSAFLRTTTPTLTALDLRSNKWEEQIDSTSLRLYLIGPLKLLQTVNGSKVTAEEAELALRTVVSSHLSMATVVSKVRTNPIALPSLSLLTTAEQLVSGSKCVGGPAHSRWVHVTS